MSCSRVRVLLGTIAVSAVVAAGCGPGGTSAGLVGQAGGEAVLNAGADVGDVYLSWDAGTFPDGTQLTARPATGEVTAPASAFLIAAVRIEATAQPLQPVRVTLTVPESAQDQSTVFLHSPDGVSWTPLLVVGADSSQHTVTVVTPSFSILGIFEVVFSEPVDTDFGDIDTPVEKNPYTQKYPLGTCMGMACFTAWYHENGKTDDMRRLCQMSRLAFQKSGGIGAKAQDVVDPLLTNLLVTLNQWWADSDANQAVIHSAIQHAQLLWALADTQRPQVVVVATNRDPLSLGQHTLLVASFEANGDRLNVYNPNDPHSLQVLNWPWDSDELSQDYSDGPPRFYLPIFVPEWFWNPLGLASAQFADILAQCKQANSEPRVAGSWPISLKPDDVHATTDVTDPNGLGWVYDLDGDTVAISWDPARAPVGMTIAQLSLNMLQISTDASISPGSYTVALEVTDNYGNPSLTPYRYTVPCDLTINVLPEEGRWSLVAEGLSVFGQNGQYPDQLYGVWGSGPLDVIVVGSTGGIWKGNGSDWGLTVVGGLQGATLRAVWGSGKNDVFAVGDYAEGSGPDIEYACVIEHFDGDIWWGMTRYGTDRSLANLPRFQGHLRGIWGSGPADVFAVGTSSSLYDPALVLHYDGLEWQQMTAEANGTLSAVWGSDRNHVFAVGGSGTILRYDGGAWFSMRSPTTYDLLAVWGTGEDDVFAVGSGPTILHYDGVEWLTMLSGNGVVYDDFVSIWGSGPHDVFAVKMIGTVFHYDGTTWSPMLTSPDDWTKCIWGSGGTDVYAVGWPGKIWRYQR